MPRADMDDPMGRGVISSTIAAARASLKQPSRPFTPHLGRSLFRESERPQSRGPPAPSMAPSWLQPARESEDEASDSEEDWGSEGDEGDESAQQQQQQVESDDEDEPAFLELDGPQQEEEEDSQAEDALAELVRGLRAQTSAMTGGDPLGAVRAAAPALELLSGSRAYVESPAARSAWRQALGELTRLTDHADVPTRLAACAAALRMVTSPLAGRERPLRVRRTQLLRVVVRLFELSTDEEHDAALAAEQVPATVLLLLRRHLDGGAQHPRKALLYATAVVKNAAESRDAQPALVQHGAFDVLVRLSRALLALCGGAPDEEDRDERWRCPPAQVLAQVTASLRYLCAPRELRPAMLEAGAVEALCALLRPLRTDSEVMLNVLGALWKLSLSEEPRARINRQPDVLDALLQTLRADEPVARGPEALPVHRARLRALFVLGNLTTTNSENRWAVGVKFHGVPLFTTLLRGYVDLYFELSTEVVEAEESEGGRVSRRTRKELGEVEDALVKLVRAIANVGAHPEVGPLVGRADGIEALVALLEYAVAAAREELMLNCVAAVTNLSYYDYSVAAGAFRTENRVLAQRRELTELLVPVAMMDHEEAMFESLRAFGNLSRCAGVRRLLVERRVGELLVLLLAHRSRDIARSAAGVLVNLAADADTAADVLAAHDREGLAAVIDLLRHAGLRDLPMATLACQLLYNYLLVAARGRSAVGALGPVLFERLLQTLEETRDAAKEAAADPDNRSRAADAKRFSEVAAALRRLQTGGGVPRAPSVGGGGSEEESEVGGSSEESEAKGAKA